MSVIRNFLRDMKAATKVETKEDLERLRVSIGASKEQLYKATRTVEKAKKHELRLQKKRDQRKR